MEVKAGGAPLYQSISNTTSTEQLKAQEKELAVAKANSEQEAKLSESTADTVTISDEALALFSPGGGHPKRPPK